MGAGAGASGQLAYPCSRPHLYRTGTRPSPEFRMRTPSSVESGLHHP
jgi:hypothetical protein